jgi:transposase
LERGRVRLPQLATDADSVTVDATELAMLLDGIDVLTVKRPRRWEPPTSAPSAAVA